MLQKMSMRNIVPFILLCGLFLVIAKPVHAIVILPAVIIIPIAKVIAAVIGALSLPNIGLGILWHKYFHTPLRKTLFVGFFLIFFIGIVLFFVMFFTNPARPLL